MRKIQLTKGHVALIDDADFEMIASREWRAMVCTSKYRQRVYAVRRGDAHGDTTLMHRFLSHAPRGFVVDHINGNGLDNTRVNLRVCTQAENLMNQGPRGTNKCGFKGVRKFRSKWMATISASGGTHYLGLFPDAISGALAYDEAAKTLHGEYARLNFPERGISMLMNSFARQQAGSV